MNNDDLGLLMICAERYALGRRSYMPSLICKIIKDNINVLSDRDLHVLIKDIEEPAVFRLVEDPWGDECNKKEWMDLLSVLKNKVN